ncbi:MAG: endonuclease/exonuclease/phosphatase family protein [Bacteroidales bacterium]|jgi:endonuclease/exonuclease/phosphatase family metal-dependent hydrolase|nr:endonuclease/exonuclease/phosphatase family protein [Bacteroidales bacterium]
MKRIFFIALMVLCSYSGYPQVSLSVMSFNIRYDNPEDGVHAWKNRQEAVSAMLKGERPVIIGMQEVLHHQLNDILDGLPGYSYKGVGRDDGKVAGEYSPVLYDSTIVQCRKSGFFWLSSQPMAAGSLGWDAVCPRICTWAAFIHKESQRPFYVFNTHYDHIGKRARNISSQLLTRMIDSITGGCPVILCGDFNASAFSSEINRIIDQDLAMSKPLTENSLADSCTFTGFSKTNRECRQIDFIFYSKQFTQESYLLMENPDSAYPLSDHRAVKVGLFLK